jgi:predicted acyl esterase
MRSARAVWVRSRLSFFAATSASVFNFTESTFGPSGGAFLSQVYANIFSGGDDAYIRQFWQERSFLNLAQALANTRIPALMWTGWGGADHQGSLELYAELQNAHAGRPVGDAMTPDEPTTGRYQIIVEPGGHGSGLDEEFQLEWYDTWLKHEHTGIQDTTTPMHLYENGSDRWINASTYPIVATYTPLFLGSGGALSRHAGAQSQAGSDSITWAAPTAADSTLTYATKPLAKGATFAGPASLTVYAQSDNSNLDLIADLYDVSPGGTPSFIATGTILSSLSQVDPARSWYDSRGQLIQPFHPFLADSYVPAGQVQKLEIKFDPGLRAIAPGDSLRLVLSTQATAAECTSAIDFVGIPYPCALTTPQQQTLPGGVYQILHGGAQPSALMLPLLPYLHFATATSGVTPTSGTQTEPLYWGPPKNH